LLTALDKGAPPSTSDEAARHIAGERIVSARLTPDAQAHGMALALPQVVMARPTGVERADAIGVRIPIEGAPAAGEEVA
jgi:hypothetical protein